MILVRVPTIDIATSLALPQKNLDRSTRNLLWSIDIYLPYNMHVMPIQLVHKKKLDWYGQPEGLLHLWTPPPLPCRTVSTYGLFCCTYGLVSHGVRPTQSYFFTLTAYFRTYCPYWPRPKLGNNLVQPHANSFTLAQQSAYIYSISGVVEITMIVFHITVHCIHILRLYSHCLGTTGTLTHTAMHWPQFSPAAIVAGSPNSHKYMSRCTRTRHGASSHHLPTAGLASLPRKNQRKHDFCWEKHLYADYIALRNSWQTSGLT